MPLNLIDALPAMGGFNRLEKDEYYRLFVNSSEGTVELLTLAAEVATANGWSQEEAIDKLQGMQSGDSSSLLALGPDVLAKMLEFDQAKKRSQLMQGYTLARLICLSRLSLEWVERNAESLAEYGVDIRPDVLADAAKVRKVDRLKDGAIALVVDEILSLLPESIIRTVEDFAIDELNEGRKPTPIDLGDRNESPLAAPAASSVNPATPPPVNANSGINATSASKPAQSKTLAITGKTSA
jgi:hypothetical protein